VSERGPGARLPDLLVELQRRARRGMELDLSRMRQVLAAFGDPHRALAAVHVAGTNGKGSVCAMVEEVARRAGLRAGLYTSPHLARFAERIRIGGAPVEDAAFAAALEAALRRAPVELTFFEAMTTAALLAFRDAGVELCILEVGLGGRLDATNVVEAPLVTAITSIALDHTDVLGPTLAHVAREKAGILKPGSPVVLGPLNPEADRVIAEVAAAVGAGPIWRVGVGEGGEGEAREIQVARRGRGVDVVGPGGRRASAELGLRGPHQADNAAVACGVVWQLAARRPALALDAALPAALAAALPAALAAARWPGRLERLDAGDATVLLDCAHNPHGAAALAAALEEDGQRPEATTLVFGALADKGWQEMLKILAPTAARRVYTAPQGRAPAPLPALAAIAPGEAVPEPAAALARALAITPPGGLVVVAGSIYLVGEIRAALLNIPSDPTIAL